MASFAEVDSNNIVLRVLVVPNEEEGRGQEYLADDLGFGGIWIQTSYNAVVTGFRKNYAGIGYTWDATRDAFIAPEPPDAIGFDEETCQWIVPEIIVETTPE